MVHQFLHIVEKYVYKILYVLIIGASLVENILECKTENIDIENVTNHIAETSLIWNSMIRIFIIFISFFYDHYCKKSEKGDSKSWEIL